MWFRLEKELSKETEKLSVQRTALARANDNTSAADARTEAAEERAVKAERRAMQLAAEQKVTHHGPAVTLGL